MKINYKVVLNGPALTGQSGIIGKDIDIVTKLNNDGLPYFTASHIKGILRDRCEYMKDLEEGFTTDKYFGNEGLDKTKLIFSNLELSEVENIEYDTKEKKETLVDNRDYLIGVRNGIRVDRETRTTIDKSLFNYEYITPNLTFKGHIDILDEEDSVKESEIKYILACLFHLDKIGGQKSRGLGSVEVTIEDQKLENLDTVLKMVTKGLEEEKKTNLELKLSGEIKEYNYELKLSENIILKSKELSNTVETLDYIQGGTIRGAIISKLARKGLPQEEVDKLIETLKVSQGHKKGTKLTPASIFKTKYKVARSESTKYEFVNKVLSDEIEVEGIKLERYSSRFIGEEALGKVTDLSITIDKESRSSKDGEIFNKEILKSKDSIFTGTVLLDTGIAKAINKNELRIGKMKNKGFGQGTFVLDIDGKNEDNKKSTKIEDRIETLNKKKHNNSNKIATIDCLSDIILPFESIHNIGEELGNILGLEGKFVEEISFVNIQKLGGYNLINNIRKSDELMLSKGSVLTYEYNSQDIEKLKKVEADGIGLRKKEGFGDIIICNPIHLGEEF